MYLIYLAPESHSGQFLVRRAEIQIGSNAHAFFRTKAKVLNLRQIENKHITWFGKYVITFILCQSI